MAEGRQGWTGFPEELLESAYAIAVEAPELIDGGREGEAESGLLAYMAENTASHAGDDVFPVEGGVRRGWVSGP